MSLRDPLCGSRTGLRDGAYPTPETGDGFAPSGAKGERSRGEGSQRGWRDKGTPAETQRHRAALLLCGLCVSAVKSCSGVQHVAILRAAVVGDLRPQARPQLIAFAQVFHYAEISALSPSEAGLISPTQICCGRKYGLGVRRTRRRANSPQLLQTKRKTVVGLGRLELPTRGLGNRCSIHLSYRPALNLPPSDRLAHEQLSGTWGMGSSLSVAFPGGRRFALVRGNWTRGPSNRDAGLWPSGRQNPPFGGPEAPSNEILAARRGALI